MINEKRLLDSFLRYVQIDSPTTFEKELAQELKKELEELGFSTRIDDAGEKSGSNTGNLIGCLNGGSEGGSIIFSAHMDTVSPGRGVKPQIRDGAVYSDGTTILGGDDKAGIAAIMEAIRVVVENDLPHSGIEVVFTIFEEGGLKGSANLDYSLLSSRKAFVLDSGGDPGRIITRGPAQNKITAVFKGKEAHAGVAPENGISAIQMAADAIASMKLLRIDEETTANIGSIEGGGATNIVPGHVTIQAEARSLNEEKLIEQTRHMTYSMEAAAKKYGGSVDIIVERAYGAFRISDESPVVKAVEKAFHNLEITTELVGSGGGSDTNNFNSNGIEAVNIAIGERNAHTLEEHIFIEDIKTSAKLVLELIKLHS